MHCLMLEDEAATVALAQGLAPGAPHGLMVCLHGDLGAGKSTFARAWLRALGVTGTIRSPTYTLVERYPLATGGEAMHLDLYRIGDAGELEFLGLDDADAALWLVEWPERGRGGLPETDLHVHLAVAGEGRSARLEPATARATAWLAGLVKSGQLHPTTEPCR